MANKVIISILVFLAILSGGLGYHSYTLSQQIYSLNQRLMSFQIEQTAQIGALSGELTTLKEETLASTGSLKAKMDETLTEIDALEGKIDETITKIDILEGEVDGTITKIDILEDDLRSLASNFSQSVFDASKVYQRVSQATVRISDGSGIIGSGFILDTEAHVVTAHHAVNNLPNIYVILPDGRVFQANNIDSSVQSDIAVLTLDDELTIEPPALADSAKVKIGEPVAVIGNPFNLTETLTTGIVSQTNRFVEIRYDSQTRWVANLIQVDAAANPGNSGCPMFNSDGEVIGMIIARVDPDKGDGIYYAVSSNKLRRVTASLIDHGSFDYPWIGVSVTNLTPQEVQIRGLETANGALVTAVLSNSPALSAGIRPNDIITAIDGAAINSVSELTSYLGEHKSPGDAASIELIRGTSEITLSLKVAKQPS